MKKYIPSNVEPKWQQKWQDDATFATDLSKPNKHYVLAEFAYPSGDLHMGHWFTWSGADIYARLRRMQGYNVFFPNGFDAFGLPAEGAAIKRGIHPQDWTLKNIESMKAQYRLMGGSFSFDHEVITCLPEYYKWNQWLFLKMYQKGLAYKGSALANWCPVDQTVLANEAIEAGKCWRCGTEVIQKEIPQWFFKITDYADRLIWPENPTVDWPDSVREGQNNWIGRSQGALVKFKAQDDEIEIYTTRLDTIFGASYLALAPEHPLVPTLTTEAQKAEIEAYIEAATKKSELERKENKQKTGVFTGAMAINPFTNQEIPIWIADYVLVGYGTGAIMAVPAHDERDCEFAKQFNLPIVPVIDSSNQDLPTANKGKLIDSGDYSGMDSDEATEKMTEWLVKQGIGQSKVNYHLHDWSISRQRYWGTPVPMINCDSCGIVPVPETDLPVTLPYDVDFMPKGMPPLASNAEWLNVKCPNCGGDAKREAETMDTFVDSSWYYLRYLDPKNNEQIADDRLVKSIMPVDIYFGGGEHTLGHTLYARFLSMFLYDLGIMPTDEFANKRVNHGIILGTDGNKMSKSKGNVVNPDEESKTYGTDTVRTYLAFFMPYSDSVGPWMPDRVNGSYRFLQRVWGLFEKITDNETSLTDEDLHQMHRTIKKVGDDLADIKFNTAVAALMEWLNYLSRKDQVSKTEYQVFLQLLSPIAPHITEELWEMLGNSHSIHLSTWPKFEDQYLTTSMVKVMVQVNGKIRGSVDVAADADQSVIEEAAKADEKIAKYFVDQTVKKVIYIPGKIINFLI